MHVLGKNVTFVNWICNSEIYCAECYISLNSVTFFAFGFFLMAEMWWSSRKERVLSFKACYCICVCKNLLPRWLPQPQNRPWRPAAQSHRREPNTCPITLPTWHPNQLKHRWCPPRGCTCILAPQEGLLLSRPYSRCLPLLDHRSGHRVSTNGLILSRFATALPSTTPTLREMPPPTALTSTTVRGRRS